MPAAKTNVFVSYSHADASLVAPVVELLRISDSLVFQDVHDIRPGKKWRDEIARGLGGANLVVVFWCDHSRRSDEVTREWRAAIAQEKDLLPLLLDATPLPPELGEYQWIDFQAAVGASHGALRAVASPLPLARARGRFSVAGLGVLAAAAAVAAVVTLTSPSSGAFELFRINILFHVVLAVAVLAGVVLLVRRFLRRRERSAGASPEDAEPPEREPREIQRHMAREIEAEILRRASSS